MKKRAVYIALLITAGIFSIVLILNALLPRPVVADPSPPRVACSTITFSVQVDPESEGDKFIVQVGIGDKGGE